MSKIIVTCLSIGLVTCGCALVEDRRYASTISDEDQSLISALSYSSRDRFVLDFNYDPIGYRERYEITLGTGDFLLMSSKSGGRRFPLGALVAFKGSGIIRGVEMNCDAEGMEFGITKNGWVHIRGAGTINGVRIDDPESLSTNSP